MNGNLNNVNEIFLKIEMDSDPEEEDQNYFTQNYINVSNSQVSSTSSVNVEPSSSYNNFQQPSTSSFASEFHNIQAPPMMTAAAVTTIEKIKNCAYLDGKFFRAVEYIEEKNTIIGECQICLPEKQRLIRGSPGISTNFLKHLKTVHYKTNSLEAYNKYKLKKKSKKKCCKQRDDGHNIIIKPSSQLSPVPPTKLTQMKKSVYLDGKFFKIVDFNENENKVIGECQLCLPDERRIKSSPGISTNFLKHLRLVHQKTNSLDAYNKYKLSKKHNKGIDLTEELNEKHIPEIYDVDDIKKEEDNVLLEQNLDLINENFIKQNEFDSRLIKFISSTINAIELIENPYFIELFTGFNLKMMNKTVAVLEINKAVDEIFLNLKNEINKISYICTVVDVISIENKNFLILSSHWIKNGQNFERNSAILAFRNLGSYHSYNRDKMLNVINEIHAEFDCMKGKVVTSIICNKCDNFNNRDVEILSINSGIKQIDRKTELDVPKCLMTLTPTYIQCITYTLNLIFTVDVANLIENELKFHNDILTKCEILWQTANQTFYKEKVRQVLGESINFPNRKNVSCNMFYESMSQIVHNKEKLTELFEALNITKFNFSNFEIKYLSEYCSVLKPLANAIVILNSFDNNYFGYVLPCLSSLLGKFIKLAETKDFQTKAQLISNCFREVLMKRFSSYFDITTKEAKEAIIAAFSLPQFKLKWTNTFKNVYNVESENNLDDVFLKLVTEAAYNIANVAADDQPKNNNEQKLWNATKSENEFFEFNENIDPPSAKRQIQLEILQYLNDPRTQLSVLNSYPNVKLLFSRYNTCLPSSSSVDKLLSLEEISKFSDIDSENFEQLVLLRANSENFYFT